MGIVSKERIAWLGREVFPHEGELRTWLTRRLPGGVDVDDVVQESYAILAGLASVAHIMNARTYLFQVAKSVVVRGLRRARIVTLDALADADTLQIPCAEPGPDAIAADRQELGNVARLIAALPPKCRQAFLLRKIEGLSQRDVALRMGISENTIEKHIGKALTILSSAIGRGGNRRLPPSRQDEPFAVSLDSHMAAARRGD